MNTIIDASSLINLVNGTMLDTVLRLHSRRFWIGPFVLGECGRQTPEIEGELAGRLNVLDEESLSGTLFLDMLAEHGLGLGETECLAFALNGDHAVCTDDAKARAMCTAKLGAARVLGTARLLQECVERTLATPEEAVAAYELMRARGGFLPALTFTYFATGKQ